MTNHFQQTLYLLFLMSAFSSGCQTDQLKRIPYKSQIAGEQREFFLYLPNGYELSDKKWPVLMFLHGNGERGNGKDELGYVMIHGPLMEAWVQKRNLPFIIIAPQLHMFGMDTTGVSYLADRDPNSIPKRLEEGVPERSPISKPERLMQGATPELADYITLPNGWDKVEDDLVGMLDYVLEHYNADGSRVYLTGLSYGGFGTWHLASTHPELFAAIAPIVGWGHPSLMPPIAEYKIPVWAFAGGRDETVKAKYFYPGINKLEELGDPEVRFTIHEDLGHDTWKRVYKGSDLYQWLLEHQLEPNGDNK
jgi:predicted peptidase